MSAITEYIDKIKSVLQSKKNADVYILNDKLTLSVFAVLEQSLKKGCGKEMLRLNIQNAKIMVIDRLLVTCYPDNKASEKVILANGGIYEKTITVDGKEINRYWINISM